MYLAKMLSDLRIELSDIVAPYDYPDDTLIRAIEKSVSLMSRLIPKRTVIEIPITRTITGESLVISSNTGTLAYKPIQHGSVVIAGKTEGTHFLVNYLTGVITEIGSLLPDTTYTVSYNLDPAIVDLSPYLTDYIKIERVEYPVGTYPPSNLTFDQYGDLLALRGGNVTLLDSTQMRIIYLDKWVAPTNIAKGTYPEHLDNALIIGSSGQALIFEAEKYTRLAAESLDSTVILLATIGDLTAPSLYTVVKPTKPSIASVPSEPTEPTLSFTAIESALDAVATEITAAKAHITSGAAKVDTATRGDQVAQTYARYAEAVYSGANTKISEGIARLKQIEETLAKYSGQVSSYGHSITGYNSEIYGDINNFANEVQAENLGITNARNSIDSYTSQVTAIINRSNQLITASTNYLAVAGRYLASGQAKINEMLVMLGVKAEFNVNKASSEQRS